MAVGGSVRSAFDAAPAGLSGSAIMSAAVLAVWVNRWLRGGASDLRPALRQAHQLAHQLAHQVMFVATRPAGRRGPSTLRGMNAPYRPTGPGYAWTGGRDPPAPPELSARREPHDADNQKGATRPRSTRAQRRHSTTTTSLAT